jgi:hypothetical protein
MSQSAVPSDDRKWFHAILTTYGAWLRGDSRGFRTRNHQIHVDGDYKSPPEAGQYEGLRTYCENNLKQPPADLSIEQREVVLLALVERLFEQGALVAILAMSARHGHVLLKVPERQTRRWLGVAKKHAWFKLRDTGWKEKLWAKRPKFVPIENRRHQLNVYNYIARHEEEGAYIWKHCDHFKESPT